MVLPKESGSLPQIGHLTSTHAYTHSHPHTHTQVPFCDHILRLCVHRSAVWKWGMDKRRLDPEKVCVCVCVCVCV